MGAEEEEAAELELRELTKQAMDELGLCGCGEPAAVLVMMVTLLLDCRETGLDRRQAQNVIAWSQQAFRPCCGTCRAPRLEPFDGQRCAECGDAWDGSEASQKEAWHRQSRVPSSAGRTFMLYWLDEQQFIEHGGSVNGAWLTQKGKEFLARYGAAQRLVPASDAKGASDGG